MPDECRPPKGTPDETWCLLTRSNAKTWYMPALWTDKEYGGAWFWAEPGKLGQVFSLPGHMTGRGWRFHSIAEALRDKQQINNK